MTPDSDDPDPNVSAGRRKADAQVDIDAFNHKDEYVRHKARARAVGYVNVVNAWNKREGLRVDQGWEQGHDSTYGKLHTLITKVGISVDDPSPSRHDPASETKNPFPTHDEL